MLQDYRYGARASCGVSVYTPAFCSTNLYCLVTRGTRVWATCLRLLPYSTAGSIWTHNHWVASPAPKPPEYQTASKPSYNSAHVLLTSDVREVSVDERLCLCVDCLDASSDDGDVRLNNAVFLQQVLNTHQVLAILLRLQVHLPNTQMRASF